MKKEFLREFDAFRNCRHVLEQNGWNMVTYEINYIVNLVL